MNLRRFILPSVLASLYLIAHPAMTLAQATGEKTPDRAADAPSAEAASLQKKANEAQTLIDRNQGDSDQLKRAVKTNEVALAKQVLLRNGFTDKDLENAKIILLTGGGKGGEDKITISVTCCDPKEITIQRTLENFTK